MASNFAGKTFELSKDNGKNVERDKCRRCICVNVFAVRVSP